MTLLVRSADAPPETRGLRRDEVRLLVATGDGIVETAFHDLAEHLDPGDLLVVNTSATLAAAVDGTRADGTEVVVHFSTRQDDGTWTLEVRPRLHATGPVPDVRVGESLDLHGTRLTVLETAPGQHRLHRAQADSSVRELMWDHGRPIRYGYVPQDWPLEAYQTVFARDPGSAEMPSAARPFTTEGVTDLARRGVLVAPVTLHTGVSSQGAGEPPQPERFRVPATTAAVVNHVRRNAGRVVAVGTTVTRALESAVTDGVVHPAQGWTDLVLGPQRPAQVVNGLVTGWHEPGASHLDLLRAVAGTTLVEAAYDEAERRGFLWHEFGDSCLLLP
ncbi:MAG: S-adenosylmethionine:tRNA ribosyltransferase-isomerase [Actinomycetota bacterium]|nr:S-adenosylmethionine:tRNA ribosyltransferase-isomerase [Actinomycetota bacterium]